MQLAEIRDLVVNGAKETKEKACRKRPTDISNTIDAFRSGEPVATIMLKHTVQSNVDVVEAFRFAATGYEADQIATMVESFTTGPNMDPGINPVTGEEIDNRTLSDLFFNHDGASKGWVRECLYVQVYNRAGDMIAATLPYHYVGGSYLVWDERENLPEDVIKLHPETDPDDLVANGTMDQQMQRLMNDTLSFSQRFPGIITEETSRAELDVLVTAAIQLRLPCSVILWAHQGGPREETIRNRMR